MLAERIDQWTKQWKNAGIQQGIQRGMQKGKENMVARLVKRRFGVVPVWVEERIKTSDESELEQWADNIIFAETINDVFKSE